MKILIAGEGGQGVQLIAELLAKAAFSEGKSSLYIPNFGVEQRGGISLAFVIVDDKKIGYPKFEKADILAILCDRAFERIYWYLNKKTKIILGPAVTKQKVNSQGKKRLTKIKAAWFPAKVWNILVLGKIINLSKIVSLNTVRQVMGESLKNKFLENSQLKELDERALEYYK